MAKIKVRPHAGALSALLKRKGMTQLDAHEKTRVDRKTLLRIDRGEEVKLETLQQVAMKLQVTEEQFTHPSSANATDDGDRLSAVEPGNIMLRKLDAERLEELLNGVEDIRWKLNAPVRDDRARKFLEELEVVVQKFWEDLVHGCFPGERGKCADDSLRHQLSRLETAKDVATRLERMAEHRLALLGADYLFWDCTTEECHREDRRWCYDNYSSSNTALLSVEPLGTQSRRVHVFQGSVPPLLAPDIETPVYVNGRRLPSPEEL
jgi:transcriptional regulator with XRE-family HTH domain